MKNRRKFKIGFKIEIVIKVLKKQSTINNLAVQKNLTQSLIKSWIKELTISKRKLTQLINIVYLCGKFNKYVSSNIQWLEK